MQVPAFVLKRYSKDRNNQCPLLIYGKNNTNISDNCQVQLEIRNYTNKPLRLLAIFHFLL